MATGTGAEAPPPSDVEVPAPRPPAGARGRRPQRPTPERVPDLAHLDLAGLRAYRQELTDEEGRVSYWRRILQARLDVLSVTPDRDVLRRLREVLADVGRGNQRSALLTVLPASDVPPLPDLTPLWEAAVGVRPGLDSADLAERIAEAERQLSAYRSTLHSRLDEATADLIARYAEDPSRCLVALPLDPRRGRE